MFEFQLKCFLMIGFNREASIKYSKVQQKLRGTIALIICAAIIAEASFIATNLDDLLASAECFGPLSIEIITLSKLFTFIVYEQKFYQLMDQVEALANQLTAEELIIIESTSKLEKRFTIVYLVSGIVTGVTLCVAPIIVSVINNEPMVELPVKAVFPFNASESPAYELTFIVLSFATYASVFICVSI